MIRIDCELDGIVYDLQPDRYVAHLLGYEGEGSLLVELKKKGYCNK